MLSAISSCGDIYITKTWMDSTHTVRRCGSGCTSLALQWYAMTSTWANKLSRSSAAKQEPPGCSQSRTHVYRSCKVAQPLRSFLSFSFTTAHQCKTFFPTSQQSSIIRLTRWPSLLFIWSKLEICLIILYSLKYLIERTSNEIFQPVQGSITPLKFGGSDSYVM